MKSEPYRITFLKEYDFDKSALVASAVAGGKPGPDAVVVQECAVYVPGPLEDYKKKYQGWIRQIRAAGAQPIVATVVPPASSQGFVQDTKDFIKVRILGRQSQFEQVKQFNDWLRQLAAQEKLPLIDLEESMRVSESDRHMRREFDSGDGIHVNELAYEKLDGVLLKRLDAIAWRR